MDEFSDIWIEQCEAARDIRDAWGTRKALGYLIGEKLLNYIRASDSDPSWAAKLPLFGCGDPRDHGAVARGLFGNADVRRPRRFARASLTQPETERSDSGQEQEATRGFGYRRWRFRIDCSVD
jgi:hypothetical protein